MGLNRNNGFALVTVLLLLLVITMLGVGVFYMSAKDPMISSNVSSQEIAHYNAVGAANQVSAWLYNLNLGNLPEWTQPAANNPVDITGNMPSELKSIMSWDITSPATGFSRLLRAERIRGGRFTFPQIYEIEVEGYSGTLGSGGTLTGAAIDANTRIIMQVTALSGVFTGDVLSPNQDYGWNWYINKTDQSHGKKSVYKVKGTFYTNKRPNIVGTTGAFLLDPEDPLFNNFEYGARYTVQIKSGENINWWGGPKPWDNNFGTYYFSDPSNPNADWFGFAGWWDNYPPDGAPTMTFGGEPEVNLHAGEKVFPDHGDEIQELIWDGTYNNSAIPGDPGYGDPSRVRIPSASRPDGGIYIWGDSIVLLSTSPTAFTYGEIDGTPLPVYNNVITIHQPIEQNPYTGQADDLKTWTITVYRGADGLPYKYEMVDCDGVTTTYTGEGNQEGLGIYVDGNIGYYFKNPGSADPTFYALDRFNEWNDGGGSAPNDYWQHMRGLEGEVYGRVTVAASQDILLTGDYAYKDFVPPKHPDWTNEEYYTFDIYLNGIYGRNVFMVEDKTKDNGDGYDVFDPDNSRWENLYRLDAAVMATGVMSDTWRTMGTFDYLGYYKYVGMDNKAPAFQSNNNIGGVFGEMHLAGCLIVSQMGVFGHFGINQGLTDGLRPWFWYDIRMRNHAPAFFPAAGTSFTRTKWVVHQNY